MQEGEKEIKKKRKKKMEKVMLEIEGEICTKKDEKNFRTRLNGRISHRRMLWLFFCYRKRSKR